jgi:hypothetical protein
MVQRTWGLPARAIGRSFCLPETHWLTQYLLLDGWLSRWQAGVYSSLSWHTAHIPNFHSFVNFSSTPESDDSKPFPQILGSATVHREKLKLPSAI